MSRDAFQEFLRQKREVDASYIKRKAEAERVWRRFDGERLRLEKAVSDEFGRVLQEISPIPPAELALRNNPDMGNAEVLKYKVQYTPASIVFPDGKDSSYFWINITKVKFPDGGILDNGHHSPFIDDEANCPHIYLTSLCGSLRGSEKELHPRVLGFMNLYNVFQILMPENNCEHK